MLLPEIWDNILKRLRLGQLLNIALVNIFFKNISRNFLYRSFYLFYSPDLTDLSLLNFIENADKLCTNCVLPNNLFHNIRYLWLGIESNYNNQILNLSNMKNLTNLTILGKNNGDIHIDKDLLPNSVNYLSITTGQTIFFYPEFSSNLLFDLTSIHISAKNVIGTMRDVTPHDTVILNISKPIKYSIISKNLSNRKRPVFSDDTRYKRRLFFGEYRKCRNMEINCHHKDHVRIERDKVIYELNFRSYTCSLEICSGARIFRLILKTGNKNIIFLDGIIDILSIYGLDIGSNIVLGENLRVSSLIIDDKNYFVMNELFTIQGLTSIRIPDTKFIENVPSFSPSIQRIFMNSPNNKLAFLEKFPGMGRKRYIQIYMRDLVLSNDFFSISNWHFDIVYNTILLFEPKFSKDSTYRLIKIDDDIPN